MDEVNFAGLRVEQFNLLIPVEGDTGASEGRFDTNGRLMVDQVAVDHGLAIRISKDWITENIDGVQSGCRGQTDLDGIEVVKDAPIFGDVVFLATEAQLGVRHFTVEQIATMALVNDHEVVLIDRGRFGRVSGKQHASDEPLNGANVDFGLRLRRHVLQPFQAENFSESLAGHDLRC